MFSTLSDLGQTEHEKKRAKELEAIREAEAMSKDRKRIAAAEQALLNSKAEAQRKKIERDALQQKSFVDLSTQMEQNALKQVKKAAEKQRIDESTQKHVFETLFSEVLEECYAYNEKIVQDQSETTLPQHFKHALEPEPARDSDDEEEAPKTATKKRTGEAPKPLLSFLPF